MSLVEQMLEIVKSGEVESERLEAVRRASKHVKREEIIAYKRRYVVILPAEKARELLKLYAEHCNQIMPFVSAPILFLGHGVVTAHKLVNQELLEKLVLLNRKYLVEIEFWERLNGELHSPHIYYVMPLES